MSSRALGNAREHTLEARLWPYGYRTMLSKGSGQRIAASASQGPLRGDIVAIAAVDSGLPHLLIEVGSIGKRLGTTFAEMTREPLPGGFVALIARVIERKWVFHVDQDTRFDRLEDALDALRAGT